MRPTVFLENWAPRDRSLALALGAFESGYYQGIPNNVVWDPMSEGHLVAVPRINQVEAAIERAQARTQNPDPGTRWEVFDVRVDKEYEDYADG